MNKNSEIIISGKNNKRNIPTVIKMYEGFE